MPEITIPNSTLHVSLGTERALVHKRMGKPDSTSKYLGRLNETYLNPGVAIQYDDDDTIMKISVAWFEIDGKCAKFSGQLNGVSLGDPERSYFEKLGPPDMDERDSHIWHLSGYSLVIEFWPEDGDEEPWGKYKKGEVRSVDVTTKLPTDEDVQRDIRLVFREMFPNMTDLEIEEMIHRLESK